MCIRDRAGSETPGDVGTVRSWDSHANYKHHLPGSSPTHSIFSGVVLYCDETHIKSGTGIMRLLLVVSMFLMYYFIYLIISVNCMLH